MSVYCSSPGLASRSIAVMAGSPNLHHVPRPAHLLQAKPANPQHPSVLLSCASCRNQYNVCGAHQDMKEKHEQETALKAERDVLAKDAADKEAANMVSLHDAHGQTPVA